MRRIVWLVALGLLLNLFNFQIVFCDEIQDKAEELVRDLKNAGMTEEALQKEGFWELLQRKANEIGKSLTKLKLVDDETMRMAVVRYFYGQDSGNSMIQFCRFLLYQSSYSMWVQKYSKQEILLKKLSPILADRKEPRLLRLEIIGTINTYFNKGGYVDKEFVKSLSKEQVDEFLGYVKKIVLDKEDDAEVRSGVIHYLLEYFTVDDETLKLLLEYLDDTNDNEEVKNNIIHSLSLAVYRNKLDKEEKEMVYDKITYIIENKTKYNESIFKNSFGIFFDFKDKQCVDYLYSLMTKTTDSDTLQRAKKAYIDNYFVFMDKTKTLKGEYRDNAREVLKHRILDNNPAIRKFCLEELLKEITGTYKVITNLDKITGTDKIIKLDKNEKKQLRELFINAKQKEKDEELIKLLDKGIDELKEVVEP